MKAFFKASGLVLGVILVVWIAGIVYHALESKDKDDRIIHHPGTYRVNQGRWSLVVEKAQTSCITYHLMDENGRNLLKDAPYMFLNWQRWSMFWEKDAKRLWVDSSDIGDYVWLPDAQGQYQQVGIDKDSVARIKTAPQAVIDMNPEYLAPLFHKEMTRQERQK